MPNPTASDRHVDQLLTTLSLAFLQSQENFKAGLLAPTLPVKHKSDKYRVWDPKDFNRDRMKLRAASTESAGGGFKFSDDSYNCERWAFHKDEDDTERANDDLPEETDEMINQFITRAALLRREIQLMGKIFIPGVWGLDLEAVQSGADFDAGTVLPWGDEASDPIKQMSQAHVAFLLNSGGIPANTLAMGRRTWAKLSNNEEVLSRISGGSTNGSPAIATRELIARLFEVERLMVFDAVQNEAEDGQPESNAFIAGDDALLLHVAPNPGKMVPSALYTFAWNGVFGVNAEGIRTMRFRMDEKTSDRFEIESYHDQKITAPRLGIFFEGVGGAGTPVT